MSFFKWSPWFNMTLLEYASLLKWAYVGSELSERTSSSSPRCILVFDLDFNCKQLLGRGLPFLGDGLHYGLFDSADCFRQYTSCVLWAEYRTHTIAIIGRRLAVINCHGEDLHDMSWILMSIRLCTPALCFLYSRCFLYV